MKCGSKTVNCNVGLRNAGGFSKQSAFRRFAVVLGLTMSSCISLADGGTVPAAFQFEHITFIAYVVVTVVVEAWMVGVRSGYGWRRSILVSVGVNAFTAFLFICPDILFPVYSQRKPFFNPNPLEWMFLPIILCALVSALIEGYLWAPRKPKLEDLSRRNFVNRSFLAHLVCVPITMAILMLPSRPYVNLEDQVFSWRLGALRSVCRGLEEDIRTQGKVTEFRSVEDLIRRYKPDWLKEGSDRWAIGYIPEYSRFDTGEQRRHTFEVNLQAMGAKVTIKDDINYDSSKRLWLIRGHMIGGSNRSYGGYFVDLDTGYVRWTRDREALGYGNAPESGR